MPLKPSCLALALFVVAGASAQSTSNVSAYGGSVAGKVSGSTLYTGMEGVASDSTISYLVDNTHSGNEFKFAIDPSGAPTGKTLSGFSFEGGNSAASTLAKVGGGSSVSPSSGPGDPDDYSISWSTSLSSLSNSDSGTYDPWDVSANDLLGLGAVPGGTVDLYYQSGLTAAAIGGSGSYELALYITAGATKTNILDLKVDSNGTYNVLLGTNPQLEVYLLGANANSSTASPDDKMFAPDASLVTATTDFSSYFGSDGTLLSPLNFGIRYHDFVFPTGASGSTALFSWHTDTLLGVNNVSASVVPGPAAGLAFAIGTLKRRKRRA